MRKYIINERIEGTLSFVGGESIENVSGEISYDVYSNHDMNGYVYLNSSNKLFSKDPFALNQIVLRGTDIEVYGRWKSIPLIKGKLEFQIDTFHRKTVLTHAAPKKGELRFLIPYVAPLSRSLKSSFGYYNEFIVKFSSEEMIVTVADWNIAMRESVNPVKFEEPDFLLNRVLKAVVHFEIGSKKNLLSMISDARKNTDALLLVTSLLLNYRVSCFGYEIDLSDNSGKLLERQFYMNSQPQSSDDFIEHGSSHFTRLFTSENISMIANALIKLDDQTSKKLRRVIYSYLTIGELRIVEPMFLNAYFALEAVSKLVVVDKGIKTEERIIKACEILNLDREYLEFEPKLKSKKANWLITEFRDELAHANFDFDLHIAEIGEELEKMIKLLRALIIGYLAPELKEFPLP